ncbi:MAG TPA: thiamine pyrophosphate-dependent enzyme [Candidatus Kapabacteria bacterium]|nr:thiamine pyrophosphate-dependent enzyme [Candidatus Kapabacteria bacterium]
MKTLPLLGDEAIAQAAIDAGISAIYAYPGTPSTEITEYVMGSKQARSSKIVSQWTANEKTAVEGALGVSYAGKRAMACMKHVGLNVAADPFMNSAITGANGGIVIVAADDPSMHSSQNEQDSRYYGNFALIPIFEPHDQQEAYDMVHFAYDFSEKYQIPILMRLTTRLAHSRAGVTLKEQRPQNEHHLPEDFRQYVLLPAIAKKRYQALLSKQSIFEEESENSIYNFIIEGTDRSLGIIAAGISYNYLMENYQKNNLKYPVLKIGQYPLPKRMISKFTKMCDEILVLEDGYPFIEEKLNGIFETPIQIHGRLDGNLPRAGELNPTIVAKALKLPAKKVYEIPDIIVGRPPELCPGCAHIDTYRALNEAMQDYPKGHVMSDIGCYTLGALPPFEAINSCVDMGASITMAKGLADSGGFPAVAVIGDSTFTHSGITGLLDCVTYHSDVVIIILDNEITGMTGGQRSLALGKLEQIVMGLGVHPNHMHVIDPRKRNHKENVDIIKNEIEYNGVSVIISRRECIVAIDDIREMKKELELQSL